MNQKTMRILMLSPYIPWPLNGGPPIRIYYVLRELVRLGHEVVLLAGYDGPSLPATHPLRALCREILTYQPPSSARIGSPLFSALRSVASPLPYVAAKFGARHIRESIQRIAEKQRFDLIWANFAFMAYAVPPELCRSVPVVLDEHESEGLLWRQYLRHGSLAKRAFAVVNLIKLPAFQKRLMSQVAAVLSNSEREADFTRQYAPSGVQVWAVPNGVDTEVFAPAQTDGNRKNAILLCSGLAVYRNRAAALWFARRMFPMVRREVPDAEFWIVGSHPNREIWRLAKVPGIHVTGTVEDVRPYYAKAKVAVAPYRYGEGTKIKVVEAMACGTPVVSTSIGCQGLDVIDGEHLHIADNEMDFSRRVIEVLCDPQRTQMLAASGRTLVEEKYGWRSIIGGLEPRLRDLLFPRCDLRVKNDVTNPGRRGGTGMKKVGVVILNWNGGPLTPRCIESLKQSEYSPWQVVVVDNGSTDGSLEEIAHRFPEVVFIKNATNLGFAEGCNQGMRWLFEQSADFALILNNDTTVHPAMISRLVATANAQDEPVCLSPKMYVSDDPCRLWFACGRVNLWTGVFSNPAYHSVDSARFDRTREMEYASGCCVLIPREIFRAVGGFDERFFAYCEDVEWSIRCRRKGFRLLLSPQAKLWHGVAAAGKKKPALMRYLMTRNHLWTVRRHANAWQFACVLLLSPLRSSWRLGKIALAGQWGCIPAEFRGMKDGLFARLGQSSLGSV